eukprot:CAMPEP_0177653434 /NCGR_PEP_ID=MMETSP0447-20121125/13733_1 /TAXON_ID=0 /ORGANISM="Stygamoeba regulata, Strain BSH-02190019" /LENGTH=346 /DNA_ID=CAMNT_0019156889 /DNA_START=21 /DNA_END=1061 /DNA_ORIENTATION=-
MSKAAVAASLGFVFGFVLEKGRVFLPSVIFDQMLMKDFTMMKMFLAASATSLLALSVLSHLAPTKFGKVLQRFTGSGENALSVCLGAGMLGAGMALSGSCPGTVFVQLGAGLWRSALPLLGGGLAAATLFSFAQPTIARTFPKAPCRTVDKMVSVPRVVVGASLAMVLYMAVFGLETIFPSSSSDLVLSLPALVRVVAWPPWAAGIVVGLLQVPALLLLEGTIGSSTAYVSVCGNVLNALNPSSVPDYMKNYLSSWQPIYLAAAALGAFASSSLSSSHEVGELASGLVSAAGGFFLVFGARLAGGCTSGHGISGFGLLNFGSMLAVAAMFGGGIPAALTLRHLGVQ